MIKSTYGKSFTDKFYPNVITKADKQKGYYLPYFVKSKVEHGF